MKTECARPLLKFDNFKSGGFKAGTEVVRVDWHERVAKMDYAHHQALQAVAANERSSRFENPPHLAKKLVL
jgi:hypothetical protein